MKIICINNDNQYYLTINKIYYLLKIDDSGLNYKLVDNSEQYTWYHKQRFITIVQVRKLKLEKIYESSMHK